jgi:hypothetical protein
MPEPSNRRVLVNFEATPEMREWFHVAAAAERKSLSEWLRGLAIVRASEMAPQPGAEKPAAARSR